MIVRKSFQFRLCPTKKQVKALQAQLDECRWLYNTLLEQRKLTYQEIELSLSKYQQSMFLPLLKVERPSLALVHSQVLQNVVDRLDKSFQAFSGGPKQGKSQVFLDFAVYIAIIVSATLKAVFPLLMGSLSSPNSAAFVLRCIGK